MNDKPVDNKPAIGHIVRPINQPTTPAAAWVPCEHDPGYVFCAPHTFGWALAMMQQGKHVRRREWREENDDAVWRLDGGPRGDWVCVCSTEGEHLVKRVDVDDLTATDWELAND